MNKTKKALASLAIAGMVLSMAPVSVFAAETETRLAGADRYLTSIKIAEKAYASADTAVVAAGNPNNLVDALAAAPLAAQEDAPIYLTDKADMNDDVVKSMKALGVDKVIVVGAAASKAVVDELKAAGFSVEEVKGADRIATAKAINAKLTAPAGTFVVGYDGVADAMSVASYAAANNYAIVVANQNGTVDGTVDADYIVGGTTRVKDIAGAKRLAGADRYDTNKQVIAELDFDFGTVYVGNGLTLADALVGSVLAAQTDSPIALTDGKTVKADVASNLTDDSVIVALGGTAAVSNAVIDAVKNPTPSTGEFKVESVKAAAANAFKVKFTKAPANTEKVTFEVKNTGTAMTTTVNWNEAKTEAALVYSANFPQGNYTVAVKDDAKELGSFELKIEQQKVSKIDITSDVLSVDSTGGGKGYAVYKVYDQYGMDITNTPLAHNIEWTVGVGSLKSAKDGVIVIEPVNSIPLLTYTNCVINGYDRNSYVTTNATLSVSQATGIISQLKLKKLTSPNDDDFNASNSTGQWYIDYEALDASGNPTTSYELIEAGVLQINAGPYLKAEIVKDPKDNKKAAISVRINDENKDLFAVDMEIPITVVLKNGKPETMSVTLKIGSRVDSITLYAPAETVASGERVIIPFVAYDRDGKQITSHTKINEDVTFSVTNGKHELIKNSSDGSAALAIDVNEVVGNQNSLTVYVMATVAKTGKNSQLNFSVQKEAEAASLSINTAKLTQSMQKGATQKVALDAALVVKDQYDRAFDIEGQGKYYVKVEKAGSDSYVSATKSKLADDVTETWINADNVGTQSVTFTLMTDEVNSKGETVPRTLDSRNYTFTVVADDKIVDYTLGALETLYAVPDTVKEDQAKAYLADLKVYGALSNGSKVILAPTFDSGKKTTIANVTVPSKYFDVKPKKGNLWKTDTVTTVAAIKYDEATKTSAASKITVVINGTDNRIHTKTVDVASSSDAAAVKSIDYSINKSLGVKAKNDRVTLTYSQANNLLLSKFNAKTGKKAAEDTDFFYFFGEDIYGTEAGKVTVYLADQSLVDSAGNAINDDVTVDEENVLHVPSGADKGSTITITAVAGSVSKTVTIVLK